jgi:DNA-binding GntR family transcriptional regulator
MSDTRPIEARTRSQGEEAKAGGGTLASSVYERLRDDIMAGEILPGERLRAEFLRERYTVGNSPVREALNRLSADGLVVREDQKGFHVSKVSRKDLFELVKTRCWLEEIALRESIDNRTVEWEETLVLAFHHLSRIPQSSRGDGYQRNPEWESMHRHFHMSLISACGSQWLLGFCAQLNDQAGRYRQLAARESYPETNEEDEHRALFEASVEGQADKAITLLHIHYKKTLDIILTLELAILENG